MLEHEDLLTAVEMNLPGIGMAIGFLSGAVPAAQAGTQVLEHLTDLGCLDDDVSKEYAYGLFFKDLRKQLGDSITLGCILGLIGFDILKVDGGAVMAAFYATDANEVGMEN